MFLGRFQHTIDSKGRMSIPVRFREVLKDKYEEGLIVTADIDHCLVAYPYEEWRIFVDKNKQAPNMDKDVKEFLRFSYSRADECILDKQGRILLSPRLREYASLKKKVVIIGMDDKFEMWNPERWLQKELSISQNLEKIGSTLARLGL